MQIFACELSFTFCDFDTAAFLMISNVVIHRIFTERSMTRLDYTGGSVYLSQKENGQWSRDMPYVFVTISL